MTHRPDYKMGHSAGGRGHDREVLRWFLILASIGLSLYTLFALSPSSYGAAQDVLGIERSGLYLGSPREIRSDEWRVYTPYIQIAVNNDLGSINGTSPYHEKLRSFQSLPSADWAMFFKPYHWGFLVLPAANAYSLYFGSIALAFILGWALLLKQLRLPLIPSLIVSTTLFFSPFVQVWWTTNAGAFALGPWFVIAWIHIDQRWLRITASAYALTVWLLACAYPPFLYATAFAMGVMILALRREVLTPKRLFDATVIGAISLTVFIVYFHELIDIIQNTVYPGRRISSGGGTDIAKLLAHLFNSLTTRDYEPLGAFKNTNACEIAVLSSLLPTYTIFVRKDGFKAWAERQQAALAIYVAGTVFLAAWIFLPVPDVVAKVTGLSMVPPGRALLGFGLLINIGCAIAIVFGGVGFSYRRIAAVLAVTILGTSAKLFYGTGGLRDIYGTADLIPYLCLALLVGCALIPHLARHGTIIVLTAALLGNVLAYGLFNPLQSAKTIFNVDTERVLDRLRERGAYTTPEGNILAPGTYGALLAGLDIPAMNHVLYYPQKEFFRRYFPTMPTDQFEMIFNRYAQVSFGGGTEPKLIAADHIEIPADVIMGQGTQIPDAGPKLVMLEERPPKMSASVPQGNVDSVTGLENGTLSLQGWLHAPLDDGTEVEVWTSERAQSATIQRIWRPDVAAAVGPELLRSGYSITLSFGAEIRSTEICLGTSDAAGKLTSTRFPNGDWACTNVQSAN